MVFLSSLDGDEDDDDGDADDERVADERREPRDGDDHLDGRRPESVELRRDHDEELRVVAHQVLDLAGRLVLDARESEALEKTRMKR